MAADRSMLNIEVVYGLPQRQLSVALHVAADTTVAQAIAASGLLRQCPEIDLARNRVGIFSRLCSLDTGLRDGDRVEIYRSLLVDPKEARRRRAAKKDKNNINAKKGC